MNLTKKTPAEIDTVWAGIYDALHALSKKVDGLKGYVAKSVERGNDRDDFPPTKLAHDDLVARLADAEEKLAAEQTKVDAAVVPFKAEWDRRDGWTRYTVVPGGHYHRYQRCSSFRWSTMVLWTPELSGLTEAELIAKLDERACTKCFPDAPVAGKAGAKPGECRMSRTAATGDILRDWREYTAARAGYAYPGLYATFCPHCGKRVNITKAGNIPGHKEPVAPKRKLRAIEE